MLAEAAAVNTAPADPKRASCEPSAPWMKPEYAREQYLEDIEKETTGINRILIYRKRVKEER